MNLRSIAANVIYQVMAGRSLSDCLAPALLSLSEARDRSLVQAICYGVCRYYSRLVVLLDFLLQKPMKTKDGDVYALLLIGLYQISQMRIPVYAAVTETVNAVAPLKKPWARGLVNAVLRRYEREKMRWEKQSQAVPEYVYAHPRWWMTAVKKAWPEHWQQILAENNAHPPFALRINPKKISRANYLDVLKSQNIAAKIIDHTPHGIELCSPLPVDALPGFKEGLIFVQDGAAQLAAGLLELENTKRVLDACAAPGGKFTAILEQMTHASVCIAVEKDKERVTAIEENIQRLSLNTARVKIICCDVNAVSSWWDGQLFERILLDAPCSASGVVRRHPDIKLLRQATDIASLATNQLQLLESLWPLLAPGGILLYATCSIFPEENERVVQTFLSHHPEAKEAPINAAWGVSAAVGRQILPGMHGMDGFYYAKLIKSAN